MNFIYSEERIHAFSNSLHFGPVLDLVEDMSRRYERPLQILDVGCASGAFSAMLAVRQINNIQYSGIDMSISRLSEGHKYYEIENLIQADCFNLPFLSNSFDIVMAMGVLYTLPSPAEAIHELLRVCGGLCVINTLGVPAGSNSEYRRGIMGENHRITLLNPAHWKDFLQKYNLPVPDRSLAWAVPTNTKGTYPVYRGSDYRLEWLHIWRMPDA